MIIKINDKITNISKITNKFGKKFKTNLIKKFKNNTNETIINNKNYFNNLNKSEVTPQSQKQMSCSSSKKETQPPILNKINSNINPNLKIKKIFKYSTLISNLKNTQTTSILIQIIKQLKYQLTIN